MPNVKKILMLVGLPASGKSTYAKKLLAEHPGQYKRVNRDLLREMIDGGTWSKANEKVIKQAELELAMYFLDAGFTVVVDDTNLVPSTQQMWQEFATKVHAALEVKSFTDVPLEECIARDKKRQNYVGEKVIRRMHRDFLAPKIESLVQDAALPIARLCDLDGTLAHMVDRGPFEFTKCESDELNQAVANLLLTTPRETSIILVSGRSEICRPHTERWLAKHGIRYDALFMRPQDDNRKDAIVKQEIYEREIRNRYYVEFILDDREQVVQLWRSLGLTCFQVAPGDFDF